MERYLGRFSEQIYAIMRIMLGLAFSMHGMQKVLGMFDGHRMPLTSLPGIAGVIELVAGLLIAVGLFAGWAAFIASGEMAVAYFMAHFPQGFWPIVNKGELAVLYCFVFLYIASRGAGIWSADAALSGSKDRR